MLESCIATAVPSTRLVAGSRHWIQVTVEVSHCHRKVPLVSQEDICIGKTLELEQLRMIKLMVMRLA